MNPQPNEGQNQAASLAAQLFGGLADTMKESLSNAPGQIMQEAKHQVGMGAHELAAALFNGSGFVMYPRGGKDDNGQQKDGQQQEGQDKGGQEQQGQEHQQERRQKHVRL